MVEHRQRWRRGRRAEAWVALWLRLKGYRILARNFRVPIGEIDEIAGRGRILALVEVNARRFGDRVGRRARGSGSPTPPPGSPPPTATGALI